MSKGIETQPGRCAMCGQAIQQEPNVPLGLGLMAAGVVLVAMAVASPIASAWLYVGDVLFKHVESDRPGADVAFIISALLAVLTFGVGGIILFFGGISVAWPGSLSPSTHESEDDDE